MNPKWLLGLPYPELRREAANIARHHVSTYRDTIQYWDAMNEAHDWANCFELTQEQLIDLTRATTDALREGNDKAVSIVNVCLPFAEYVAGRYNCYGALPEHLRSPLSYFKAIIEAGIDFDVVGIQLYFPGRDLVAVDLLLNAFAALGKPIHITVMGVNGGFRQKGVAKLTALPGQLAWRVERTHAGGLAGAVLHHRRVAQGDSGADVVGFYRAELLRQRRDALRE